jgi:hypothetical protein
MTRIRKRLEKFDSSLNQILIRRLKQESPAIIWRNVEQVGFKGINIHGKPIINKRFNESRYADSYLAYKKSLGLYQGFIDLQLSGKYLKSLKVFITGDSMEIRGTRKIGQLDLAGKLRGQFPDHEGLTDESLEAVKRTLVKPHLEYKLRQAIA